MRSKSQNVKRYFTGIWSVLALVTGILATAPWIVTEPMPSWAVSAVVVAEACVGGVIGFLHGATAMYAKQLDNDEAGRKVHDGEEDSHGEYVG